MLDQSRRAIQSKGFSYYLGLRSKAQIRLDLGKREARRHTCGDLGRMGDAGMEKRAMNRCPDK